MRVAEPTLQGWKANLALEFERQAARTVLSAKRFEGPLAIQKPFYPEGDAVCHGIVVHPPGGIAGGDELEIEVGARAGANVLLTTPGAGKWYRSAGPWARQGLSFSVAGALEWLPRETIVFDGARASLECRVELSPGASYIGWEVICLGRSGSGERFDKGEVRIDTRVLRGGRPLWVERGAIAGGGRLMRSPAGLGGHTVLGTLVAASDALRKEDILACRGEMQERVAITLLPGVLVARSLGDSSEAAMDAFIRLWSLLRPLVLGRAAVRPRIWST